MFRKRWFSHSLFPSLSKCHVRLRVVMKTEPAVTQLVLSAPGIMTCFRSTKSHCDCSHYKSETAAHTTHAHTQSLDFPEWPRTHLLSSAVTYLKSWFCTCMSNILIQCRLNKILFNPVCFTALCSNALFPLLISFPLTLVLFTCPAPKLLLVCWTPSSVCGQVFSSCALPHPTTPHPCFLTLTRPAGFGCNPPS